MNIVDISGLNDTPTFVAIDQLPIRKLMRPWIDGVEIDREIAEETPCDVCGAAMKYDARYESGEDTWNGKPVYRAFAVCTNPECGNECEF